MDDEAASIEDGVTWRQLQHGLWVVRADGRPLGVIERGRRYSVTDVNERTTVGLPSFEAALRLLVHPSAPSSHPASPMLRRERRSRSWGSVARASHGLTRKLLALR